LTEEFDADEPLAIPFECEMCSFSTTNSVEAFEHTELHADSNITAKEISRWEPSITPIRTSVIVKNPNPSI